MSCRIVILAVLLSPIGLLAQDFPLLTPPGLQRPQYHTLSDPDAAMFKDY